MQIALCETHYAIRVMLLATLKTLRTQVLKVFTLIVGEGFAVWREFAIFAINYIQNMKIGDTVRFLNDVGGGVVTRIDDRIAYVRDEDGFETPMAVKELVVVLPAGHEAVNPYKNSAKLMFDQSVNDAVKARDAAERRAPELTKDTTPAPQPEPVAVEETAHGEKLSLSLAFEPSDIKRLGEASFAAVLVNDSNYFLSFILMRRDDEQKAWAPIFQGEVAPNELIDLASYTQETIRELERIVFQAIAYKKGKSFQIKSPLNVSKKLDLTKFFKVHCFRPGVYFDSPVIELPIFSERRK